MSIEKMDSEEPAPTAALTELERNALARAERLRRFQAQASKTNNKNDEALAENDESEQRGSLVFRSYQPIGSIGDTVLKRESDEAKFTVVDRKIENMVQDTHETVVIGDELDLNILAPKKVDWDLQRGIQSKLDTLGKRTEKAISQLIRNRLNEGNSQLLPAAINSALKAQQQSAEEENGTSDNED